MNSITDEKKTFSNISDCSFKQHATFNQNYLSFFPEAFKNRETYKFAL